MAQRRAPRILVTGFEPFPGAPVNPTQGLVERLRDGRLTVEGNPAAEMLPVDYAAISARLSEIGARVRPDIALHFGLSASCAGFRLERAARNAFLGARPDNRGFAPCDGPICAGAEVLGSTLPLEAMHAALTAEGLQVDWSDDAGGYLCNVVFTLSLAAACEGFDPAMSGFVHVPPVGDGCAMSERDLDRGVAAIVNAVLRAWKQGEVRGQFTQFARGALR